MSSGQLIVDSGQLAAVRSRIASELRVIYWEEHRRREHVFEGVFRGHRVGCRFSERDAMLCGEDFNVLVRKARALMVETLLEQVLERHEGWGAEKAGRELLATESTESTEKT